MNVIGKIKSQERLYSFQRRKATNAQDVFGSDNIIKKPNSLGAKIAFTLAEVLIVIGLIGIVAEMTIPTLIVNVNEEVTVVSLKKVYSVLTSAYELAEQENGTPDTWTQNPMIVLKPYLKVIRDCSNTSPGCFAPEVVFKLLTGQNDPYKDGTYDISGQPALTLADGTNLMYEIDNASCANQIGNSPALQAECGQIYVDVNGDKGPNEWGRDAFIVYLTKFGIIPFGTADETSHTFANMCQDTSKEGYSCSGWIIYNGNMDYLKCNDLAWGGKTKCD